MNARIVRQIVRHGLVAVQQISRTIRRVHDLHRRLFAALRRQIGGGQGKRFLQIRHIFLIKSQLLALRVVANHHRSAVGGFDAQQRIVINLVRRKHHIKFRIFQIQPCDVASEVIIRQQRVSPQPQEFRKCRIIAHRRSLAQVFRHRLQKFTELDVVGNRDQLRALPARGLFRTTLIWCVLTMLSARGAPPHKLEFILVIPAG